MSQNVEAFYMVYSAFGGECLLPQLCHPQTDSSIELYQCCCTEQQHAAKYLFPKTCLALLPLQIHWTLQCIIGLKCLIMFSIVYLLERASS